MSYVLRWKNPALPGKAAAITVAPGAVVSDKASLRFTGKGAPGYGSIQQENLMRLLENFADSTPPLRPTVGQQWYDTSTNTPRVCISVNSDGTGNWKAQGGIQVANTPPNPAALGDIWFQRTGSDAGTLYIYTGSGRHPQTATTIGGWHQLWPTVETVAGREEYDSLLAMVNELVGPAASGGSEAIGKILPAMPNLPALDADLFAKHVPAANEPPSQLKVDVTSADWDLLLAAAKYAVARLDLPPGLADDISPVPFVSDGQPAPKVLTDLPNTDIRYPTLDRRSNRRFGTVTLVRAFTETVNVLKAAVANKYAVKGINGATGTNPAWGPTTEVVQHASFAGAAGGAASETIAVRFNFPTAAAMQTFLNSGGAIQVTMSHSVGGSGTAADTNVKNLFDSRGVMRFTADRTRVLSNVTTPALATGPISTGLKDAPAGGQVLTSQTSGGATVTVTGAVLSPTQLSITIAVVGGGAMNGTSAFVYHVIRDTTVSNGTRVYGSPNAYVAGDKLPATSTFLV